MVSFSLFRHDMIIALDIGSKRIGVAIADESLTLARPLITYNREGGVAEHAILELISRNPASTIVAGLPLDESGQRTTQCESVEKFCRRLARRANIEIVYRDEYASSVEATEILSQKRSRSRKIQKEKGMVDAMAAAVILQGYLEENQSTLSKLHCT